jgi:hypothetical protein
MTFEEAAKARNALLAIAQILQEYGITTEPAHEREKKLLGKITKIEQQPKKRKNGRHRSTCANPGCIHMKKGKRRNFLARGTQRFCTPKCGAFYFTKIRSYARAVVRKDDERVNWWLTEHPWIDSEEAATDRSRILALERDILLREQQKAKKPKGITIMKNTPTA